MANLTTLEKTRLELYRQERSPVPVGWKAIAKEMGVSVVTAKRYYYELGLPVRKMDPTSSRSHVYMVMSDYWEWCKSPEVHVKVQANRLCRPKYPRPCRVKKRKKTKDER